MINSSYSTANSYQPLKVFISYSHKDLSVKEELVRALSSNPDMEILSDDLLQPGSEWAKVLSRLRTDAGVFLLLVSRSYLESETVRSQELPEILAKAADNSAYIVPVILEECNWGEEEYAKYQAVPKFGKAVNTFENKEDAYNEISEALDSLNQIRQNRKAQDVIQKAKRNQSKSLELNGCNLESIPRDLLEMPWLTHLYLNKNAIRKIENLENLVDLEHLNLANNQITGIENLDNLLKLSYLDLERNKIFEIKNLEHLTNLKVLGLSTNFIEKLSGITQLTQLETLYLGRNRLKEIEELAHMPQLRRVVLTDNSITSIRPLLSLLENGITVELKYALKADEPGYFIKGNPVSDPPVEVIALGNKAILDHFTKSKEHGEEKLEILKLILVGNSGVGKTNFSQFLRKVKLNKTHQSTQMLDIQTWKAPFLISEGGDPMRVNIFDFGGQDYYHDAHRLYYSHDTAYVLLWDTSSNFYSERQEILADRTDLVYEDYPIEYWLESIQYNLYGKEIYNYGDGLKEKEGKQDNVVPSLNLPETKPVVRDSAILADLSATAPVLVLQNKIDLGEGLLNQGILRAKYPNVTNFFNISLTAEKNKRVKVLFEVMDAFLSKLNLAGRRLVSYQNQIIEKYLESECDFEVLPLNEFKEKCAGLIAHKGIALDSSDAKTIASVLMNLGVVYFAQPEKDDNSNDGVVFTRIDQLNELIKEIMNAAKLGNDKGLFKFSQVEKIEHVEIVLDLLKKNLSVIELNKNEFLVPQFLPVKPDPNVELFAQAFVHCNVRYIYSAYFHKSILMSLFAKFLRPAEGTPESAGIHGHYYWRNGLVLSKKANERIQMVFVSFIKETTACRIEIRTMFPFQSTGLEKQIEKELDELNIGWTCSKELSANSEDFFPVNDLHAQVNEGNFIFRKNKKAFTVSDFKHLVTFSKAPKKIFISYSSKNSAFVKRLVTHLEVLKSSGIIEPWYDRMIEPGTKWDDSIKKEMNTSDVIIFLLTPEFLATEYIMKTEVPMAINQAKTSGSSLFFIEALACSWEETSIWDYQQTLDPQSIGKETIVVKKADDDTEWKKIVKLLKGVLVK
ncbi:TIR domain-containing protein [Dyadobacter sp. NIV53]|uniref:TIR domain-containing protein n=1 Tax=Dyadobacter sp. NIV53 TaxID=2861765 RepID=UPI001C87E65F|nr:TIR domain-containing protein [Dyadobacter sp. NIV53]